MKSTPVIRRLTRFKKLFGALPSDLESIRWKVVYEHHYSAMTYEYDIEEVDEALYLAVLIETRQN